MSANLRMRRDSIRMRRGAKLQALNGVAPNEPTSAGGRLSLRMNLGTFVPLAGSRRVDSWMRASMGLGG